MEDIKEQQPETKTYSQEEYDNAIAGTKKRMEKRIEKDFVSREDYDTLMNKYNALEIQSKSPHIKDLYIKNGGKEVAFNDYIKLNQNLFQAKDDNELAKMINDTKQTNGYMFNQEFKATINQNKQEEKVNGLEFLGDTLIRIK